MRTVLPVLAALAIAGCLDPASLLSQSATPAAEAVAWATTPDWALRALPFETPHNHSIADHHRNLSTPNWEVLGWDPLVTDFYGATAGAYFCGEVSRRDGNRTMAYVNSFTTDVAFVGVDVTDPLHPVKASELSLPNARVYDLTVTPDGKWVLLALVTDRAAVGPQYPATPQQALDALPRAPDVLPAAATRCRDGTAAAEPVVDPTPYPGGVLLVDVSDPAVPRVADYLPQPNGVHSISAAEIDGLNLILASITNLVHPASYFSFLEVVDGKLEPRYVHRPAPIAPERTALVNGHVDGTIHRHPVTGQLLAYLADFDGGLTILDISDFGSVTTVSQWSDYRWAVASRDDLYGSDSGNIHGALPIDGLWNDRHYTLVGQEVANRPADAPSGKIFILDTTDPANPTYVSGWTLPVEAPWDRSILFSTHYPILVDRMMFLGMYHGGVWAVDLADVEAPRTAGVFVPDRWAPGMPGADNRSKFSPAVLEVLPLPSGDLVTFDGATGAYTLRFHRDVLLPPVVEWELLDPVSG